mmetsp:Transcript_11181/g.22011  ORF Transcript_11181/g.22011 Transcript_11181/m.22011 type:complete len:102 (+) Transcript_11181:1416-1721(+)
MLAFRGRLLSSLKTGPSLKDFLSVPDVVPQEATPDYIELPKLEGLSYYLETYGCQMNANDSEIVSGVLEGAGMTASESASQVMIQTGGCDSAQHLRNQGKR